MHLYCRATLCPTAMCAAIGGGIYGAPWKRAAGRQSGKSTCTGTACLGLARYALYVTLILPNLPWMGTLCCIVPAYFAPWCLHPFSPLTQSLMIMSSACTSPLFSFLLLQHECCWKHDFLQAILLVFLRLCTGFLRLLP